MINELFVELSRWQFAVTAMYHFIFVPLTLGMVWILFIMESVYVLTGNEIYKDMTRFWGKLFGINFALGVATGLTMEFEFGTNWSYYAHYVGDIFGAPLAIEALVAFFLESTFIGLFFLGWERLSKKQHLLSTFLMAFGSNLSALWILVANGWMQFPVHSRFSPQAMRMEMEDFLGVITSPVAQTKFLHTVSAGYVTACVFVLAISAWYMLKKRNVGFARRSANVAAAFGLFAIVFAAFAGDESGYEGGIAQPAKLAALEAEFETHPAPAALTLFAIPNQTEMRADYAIQIPALLGLIAKRSTTEPIIGLKDIVIQNEARIRSGMQAYGALQAIKAGDSSFETAKILEANEANLGFGLLLKRYTENVTDATEEQILEAAQNSIPLSWPLFFSFRIMVGIAVALGLLILGSLFFSHKGTLHTKRWFLWLLVLALPLPWVACELGWIIAELGRQPWAIEGVLPTFLATSQLSTGDLVASLALFIAIYTILFIIEVTLMVKAIKKGPAALGTGRYDGEMPETIPAPAE